jgi:hypothetical protein
MAAEDNLSSGQFYHASPVDLTVGDVIKPSSKYRVAHATTSIKYATDFGEAQTHPEIYNERGGQAPLFGAVYTVAPVDSDEMRKVTEEETSTRNREKNVEVPAEDHMRFSKKGFKVTGLHKVTNNYKSWGISSHEMRNR